MVGIKIALVHSPYFHQKFMENLDFVSDNFGCLPPLGLMYVSSILKNNGHEVCLIDCKAENLSKEKTVDILREFKPDLVGLMLTIFMGGETLKWAKYIKEKLNVPIIVGNYAMIHYAEAVIHNNFIDYGIVGSAREALPKLLDALENNKKIENIEGLAFRNDKGEIVVNYPSEITEDLDKLPYPDREIVDNSLYYSMASKKNPFTILITSYGCPFLCDFCDMGKFGYRERSVKSVVDEIEECVNKFGIKEIDIFDRDFLINKERSKKICLEILNRGIDVSWSCRARVDQVDENLLKTMKRAGCRLIMYGVESGNQKMLDRENKGITIQQIKEAINLTKQVGMEVLGFLIIGHPGETEETIEQTIKFSKELPLDYIQFFKMTGKPGAKLYKEVVKHMGYDYFEEFLKGNVEEMDLPRPWTNLTNKEIEEWVMKAYVSFYLRPTYIFQRLLKIGSFGEFLKYAKIGLKVVKLKLH